MTQNLLTLWWYSFNALINILPSLVYMIFGRESDCSRIRKLDIFSMLLQKQVNVLRWKKFKTFQEYFVIFKEILETLFKEKNSRTFQNISRTVGPWNMIKNHKNLISKKYFFFYIFDSIGKFSKVYLITVWQYCLIFKKGQ